MCTVHKRIIFFFLFSSSSCFVLYNFSLFLSCLAGFFLIIFLLSSTFFLLCQVIFFILFFVFHFAFLFLFFFHFCGFTCFFFNSFPLFFLSSFSFLFFFSHPFVLLPVAHSCLAVFFLFRIFPLAQVRNHVMLAWNGLRQQMNIMLYTLNEAIITLKNINSLFIYERQDKMARDRQTDRGREGERENLINRDPLRFTPG